MFAQKAHSSQASSGSVDDSLELIGKAASHAAKLGGQVVMQEFGRSRVSKRKGSYDVQTSADIASEEAILHCIKQRFPNHSVCSEESQQSKNDVAGQHLWVIDPIDGSNNYILDIPYFGVSVSYFRDSVIVLAAVDQPVLGRSYFVRRGYGTKLNGESVRVSNRQDFDKAAISLVTDYSIPGRESVLPIERVLKRRCTRVLEMWAPAMDLCLIAQGTLDGMICWNTSYLDICAGLLMVTEAGGIVSALDGQELPFRNLEPWSYVGFLAASNGAIHANLVDCLSEARSL